MTYFTQVEKSQTVDLVHEDTPSSLSPVYQESNNLTVRHNTQSNLDKTFSTRPREETTQYRHDKDNIDESSQQPIEEDNGDMLENIKLPNLWDGVCDSLHVGMMFQSRSIVKKFLSIYGERPFCNMVVSVGGATDGCKSRQVM